MSFWSFLKKKGDPPPAPAPAPDPPARTEPKAGAPADQEGLPSDIALLLRAGERDGPSTADALALLRHLRSTAEEGRAIDELMRVHAARALPEPLVVAMASALVDRGEARVATRVLTNASSSSALLMRADLAAQDGEIAKALAFTERVMLRDFDHPGARERHQRFRTALGFTTEAKRSDASGATVVTREPDAPFRLLREVARGGAGAVYEAEDRELLRRVALKVYHHPERDRAQLAHEARVAVDLEGPALVRVFDLDPDHGWIALEWAMHGTLRECVRARDLTRLLPIERWALPLALALARVHAHGWVHHDVKPANVLLARSGASILTDFGIARRVGEPSPAGSLGYLSPERMAGRVSDPRDDVYGFGRVLEDVLHVVTDEATAARFRPLALACTGPDVTRPADARALVTRMRVEILGG